MPRVIQVGHRLGIAQLVLRPAEADELLARDGRAWRRIGEEDVDLRTKHVAEKKVAAP